MPRPDTRYPSRGILLMGMALTCAALVPPTAHAGKSSVPSVSALNKLENARSQGLGGAGVALGRDIGLVWLNPASAQGVTTDSISFTGQRGMFGESTGQAVGTGNIEAGTIIVGAGYYDAGEAELTAQDFTTRTVKAQRDFVGEVGFASSPQDNLAVGAAVKYLSTELAEEFKASALAVDVGGQMNFTDSIKAGLALRNIGKGYRYRREFTQMPTTISLGLAGVVRMAQAMGIGLTEGDLAVLTADMETKADAEILSYQAGLEYRTLRVLVLRAGARESPNEAMRSFSAGLGVMLKVPLGGRDTLARLDYAVHFGDKTITQPHILGLTVEFGARIPEKMIGESLEAPADPVSPEVPAVTEEPAPAESAPEAASPPAAPAPVSAPEPAPVEAPAPQPVPAPVPPPENTPEIPGLGY